jgi:hypothetical protein
MNTFKDVIAKFGGPAKYGRAIGISTERAAEQRARGSIPPVYWPAVVNAANELGISEITVDVLAALYAERRQEARAS